MRDISFLVAPIACHAFFEQAELERLLRYNLLQITGFTAQILYLVSRGSTRSVPRQTPFASLHEVLRPFVVNALGDALAAAQFSDAVLATKPVQHDPDLLFRRIVFPRRSLDIFDDFLARTFACSRCLSHLPLLSGYDEPRTLSYQITLFGPISADVRHGDANPWDAAKYLETLINRLGGLTSSEAVAELSALRDEPTDGYTDQLKRAFAEQAQKVVEDNYKSPTISELESVLCDGPPSSMNQLQAVMLEELTEIQGKIRSHPVDWYRDFFSNGLPKGEEECRDTLLKMFGDYPYGILCEPEGHLADDKRADIRCTIDQLMLPIEIKGQWHKDLWNAADKQLDRLYSNDWRAEHKGIYLVFWFGENVPKNKKLKPPGKGTNRPTTADELRVALIENSVVAKQGGIEVIVLDLVRP
jgi:hypothetical protein